MGLQLTVAPHRINLNRPFAINRMQEYLPHAKKLLTSPYCRPVDHRICAYIDGFIITGLCSYLVGVSRDDTRLTYLTRRCQGPPAELPPAGEPTTRLRLEDTRVLRPTSERLVPQD